MRKGRFSEEQMVAIIREGDRDPVAAVAKRHGISEQTIYTWSKRFGALQANDVKRLRQFEAENARLKKLVAERDLEIDTVLAGGLVEPSFELEPPGERGKRSMCARRNRPQAFGASGGVRRPKTGTHRGNVIK